MLLESFEAGPAATLGYLVADEVGGPAVAIDAPLGTATAMIEQATRWRCPIACLLTTHGHWDHVLDNDGLVSRSGARYGIHADSAPLLGLPQTRWFGLDMAMPTVNPDFFLAEGKPLSIGGLRLEILDCPGHCPGSVALFEPNERVVFTGDVLFAGSIGRTDLWGADHEQLLRSIREKLFPLGDDVRVYAGHGPATTIGRERRANPFLAG